MTPRSRPLFSACRIARIALIRFVADLSPSCRWSVVCICRTTSCARHIHDKFATNRTRAVLVNRRSTVRTLKSRVALANLHRPTQLDSRRVQSGGVNSPLVGFFFVTFAYRRLSDYSTVIACFFNKFSHFSRNEPDAVELIKETGDFVVAFNPS